ncbi:lipopolysaccharide transport periplasmic protein LptA [Marinibactrum halimedae]|uniref:Lipopolysaccharide export system protein LptA n=1 Tax=Marinibactrum halimedae TaxID=1444977 RepID=A0AA37T8M9_9GAMM|nr:lipopolysaccharide transport periplasmic protein LptA [Marinibactrum halimedae]MCD9457526.1 lipopolysaccharide transport periplasmic protein LptA [Marinibactrum halimedae]GLS25420.1 hypothetical protein GCM10007877_11340 [Marinibactrum halimedae]
MRIQSQSNPANQRINTSITMKTTLNVLFTTAIVTAMLFCSSWSLALPEDRFQQIEVVADRSRASKLKGVTVLIGNVEIIQGSMKIMADKVTIEQGESGPKNIIAVGEPAKFEQRPKPQKGKIFGEASTIHYYVDKETLKLIKHANVKQDGSSMTSETIEYDMRDSVVIANRGPTVTTPSDEQVPEPKDNRVRIIIPPQQTAPTEASTNAPTNSTNSSNIPSDQSIDSDTDTQ